MPRYDEYGEEIIEDKDAATQKFLEDARVFAAGVVADAQAKAGISDEAVQTIQKQVLEEKGSIGDVLQRIYVGVSGGVSEEQDDEGDTPILRSAKSKIRAMDDEHLTRDEAMEAYGRGVLSNERYEPIRKKFGGGR